MQVYEYRDACLRTIYYLNSETDQVVDTYDSISFTFNGERVTLSNENCSIRYFNAFQLEQ